MYGWDSHDQCYDNTTLTGWHKGFPDAVARLDLATHRNVPWDDGVDFFLGSFVRTDAKGREEPFPLDPRQVLARVLRRAEKLGLAPMCSLEFEFFNFAETPHTWAEKKGVDPEPITPGMFGYSLLRANHAKDYFKALFTECGAFRRADRGPAHRNRARRLRGRDHLQRSDGGRRPGDAVQVERQGDRCALRHHAELHVQVEPAVPRLLGARPPEPVRREDGTCSTTRRAAAA